MCTPAPGQGVIALQCRAETELAMQLAAIDDNETRAAASLERAIAAALGASCNTAFGAIASVANDDVTVEVCLASPNGQLLRTVQSGSRYTVSAIVDRTTAALRSD